MKLDDLQSGCGVTPAWVKEHGEFVVRIFEDDFAMALDGLNMQNRDRSIMFRH